MPSTLLSLHYHVVFGTKDHVPSLADEWRPDLHAFLGGLVRSLGGIPENVGGAVDHVHLLMGLRATHCLADTMRELKALSSGWIHNRIGDKSFAWQEGYGAFTVSASQRRVVCAYIAQQEAHHRRFTFADEYRHLLRRSGVEFNERSIQQIRRPYRGLADFGQGPVAGATG